MRSISSIEPLMSAKRAVTYCVRRRAGVLVLPAQQQREFRVIRGSVSRDGRASSEARTRHTKP